ncbi:MAG: dockerin type I repeat-containing protein [Phycisphaerales bacterium]|nr:dockerin type I repeat-containing protein [Phycisphaerales bacterium]
MFDKKCDAGGIGRPLRLFTSLLVLCSALSIPTAAQHDEDLWPAVSAGGVLKLSPAGFDPADDFIDLPAASGLLVGWSSNDPGFDDVNAADVPNDCYPFEPGRTIRLRVLALDPALNVWTAGLSNIGVGSSALLGSTNGDVHTHLIWHVRSNTTAFDPLQTLWRGRFQLFDSTGQYADSDPFTLRFRNVVCTPGDVNGDDTVNNFDIDAFVAVLLDPQSATAEARCAADLDLDGFVTNFDIDPFVARLLGE